MMNPTFCLRRRPSQVRKNPAVRRFRPEYELLEDRLTPTLTLSPATLPAGIAGTLYNQSITATGGNAGDTYSFAESGALPVGISLSSSGQLAGNPGQTGSFPITITATDNNQPSLTGQQNYTLAIGLGFLATNLPPAIVGSAYSNTTYINPVGGSGKYTFSDTWTNNLGQNGSGAFGGLSISPTTGQITGTPTAAGLYTVAVKAADQTTGLNATQTVLVSVGLSIAVTTNPAPASGAAANALPQLTVGTAYSASNAPAVFSATGGPAGDAYQFSMIGSIPGMTLTAGKLVGTPTQAGSYSFTITASDATHTQLTSSQRYTINVAPSGLTLTPSTSALPVATAGNDFAQSFLVTGGSGNYTFTQSGIPGGRFPINFSTITPSGTLSPSNPTYAVLTGTPGAGNAGTYPFTVTVTDANNTSLSVTQNYTLTIDALTISLSSNSEASVLPPATVGQAYASQTLSATGGAAPYTYAATGLPSWLSFSTSTGTLTATGMPTQSGLYDITITATDSSNTPKHGTLVIPLVVFPAQSAAPTTGGTLTLAPASPLTAASANTYYTQTITASGGEVGDTYTFHVTGTLPTGLALQTNGQLSGVPTIPGSFNFVVVATDNLNASVSGSQQYSLTVTPPPASPSSIALTPMVLPPGNANNIYQPPLSSDSAPDYQITANGGTGPYTYSSTGTLPPGILLAPNGLFVGNDTPTSISAASNGALTNASTINVASTANFPTSGTLVIETASGQASVYYSGVTATSFTGCASKYKYAMSTGNAVFVEGTPTEPGTFPFSVTVQDNAGHTTTQAYDITVEPNQTGYYSVQQIRHAYGIDNIVFSGGVLGDGTGQTVAIIAVGNDKHFVSTNAANFLNSDLHKFDTAMGIADPPSFLKLDQYGGTNYPSKSDSDNGETSQDVEWVHALAPGANIILFEADDTDNGSSIAIQTAMNTPGVSVITYSYGNGSNAGSNESSQELASDYIYLPATGKNVTFVNASGDNKGVQFPVAGTTDPSPNPYVLAATMTSMTADAQGNFLGELDNTSPFMPRTSNSDTGNNIPNYGPSTYESQPSYQAGIVPTSNSIPATTVAAVSGSVIDVATTANFPGSGTLLDATTGATITFTGIDYTPGDYKFTGCTTNGIVNSGDKLELADSNGNPLVQRAGADVAFNGVWDTGAAGLDDGEWTQANGTSIASPSWAALLAIANQGRALAGEQPLNGPVNTLPMLYDLPASDFNKITYLWDGSPSIGDAIFNQSGLGSPVANRLIPGLVGGHDTISGQVIANGVPGTGRTVYLSNTPGAALTPQEATTTTDTNGDYSFLIAPGTYYVNAIPPAGGAATSSTAVAFTAGQDAVQVVNLTTSTTANQTYINNVYQLLFGRNADSGASFWVNLLNGGASPASVVLQIEGSTEYLNEIVNGLYVHYLNRPADPGGLASWTSALSSGTTIESVTESIIGSSEYFSLQKNNNTTFVQSLYKNILGRNGSSGEVAAWVTLLSNGESRSAVATTFLTSTEYRTDLIGGGPTGLGTYPYSPNWEGYYPEFLQRPVDANGLAVWLSAMQIGATDQQVLADIFGSPEGYNTWS